MLLLLLPISLILFIIYYKLIAPLLYWKKRNVPYLTPLNRLVEVFLNNKPFPETIREAYNQFPNKRYYGNYVFLHPSLFVRDLELIKRICVKDFDHFTDHVALNSRETDPILGNNLFNLKGQEWKDMRTILTPAFTSSKMKLMFEFIWETAENFTNYFLLKNKPNEIVLEMSETYAKFTNDVIANCAFGIKCDSLNNPNNEFYLMGKSIITLTKWGMFKGFISAFFPKFYDFFRTPVISTKITKYFCKIIKDTIIEREKNQIIRPDMIHLLMEAKKDSNKTQINDDLIMSHIIFFIAGYSTTSRLLSFLSYEIAVNPEVQEKLHKEIDNNTNDLGNYQTILNMKYLDQVINETLRKWPPGFILNRICVKDYIIEPKLPDENQLKIEENGLITIPTYGLHMSPDFFPEPDRFDPERFSEENKSKILPGTYLPFGFGPRNCIGSRFALLEIKSLLVSLLSRFEIVITKKTVIPLRLKKQILLEPDGGVWLGLKRRNV